MTVDNGSRRGRPASGSVLPPKRLKQIVAFALTQPDAIAEDAGVQPSTLVRFGQALGFTGLQVVFRDRPRNQVSNHDERMLSLRPWRKGASKSAVFLDGLCESARRSISSLRERIDMEAVEKATRILAGAETIRLVAQRRSFPVTSCLSHAPGKLGPRNVLVGSVMGTDPQTLSFASPRAIPFAPDASATVDHARQLGETGVPLVAITDSPVGPLTPTARIWFEVVDAGFQGFRSMSARLALAMSLALGAADLRRDTPSAETV